MNETACLERGQRHQEAIGRDQIHFRMARPAREQCLKQSRCGALPHCDAACDTDHERDVRPLATEERRRRVAKVLRGADVEVEQTRQRQVDVGDFIERDPLVEADESPQLRFGERQRRRSPQPGPLGAAELDESRDSDILAAAGHAAILWHQAMRRSVEGQWRRRPAETEPALTAVMSQGHHGRVLFDFGQIRPSSMA